MPAALPLAGEWTLESFCDHLDGRAVAERRGGIFARLWRNWAFESAALDLALRQAGRPLHGVLGREPQPLRFVNSLGLGDPPATDAIHRRLARFPAVHFKLDAAADWSPCCASDLPPPARWRSSTSRASMGLEVEDDDALATMYGGT